MTPRQPPTEPDDDPVEDLLWELDVTSVRPGGIPLPPPSQPHLVRAPDAKRGRGRFHRPELLTPWERIAGNVLLRTAGAVVLVGGTVALVVIAVQQ